MLGYGKYVTVIMDGSNKKVVEEITGVFDMVTRRLIGKTRCRKLDKNHPSMLVITTYTSTRKYWIIRRIIEKAYPGLCTFNAVV